MLSGIVFSQTVHTFTNAGKTGANGPNQLEVNSAYTGTSLEDKVTVNTRGFQEWTVPQTRPKLCIATSNIDPLPSNTPGYPMSLKEWDSSRVISNTYINKKWAMDQVDSS